MATPPDHDRLDELLREDLAYIDDAGFTALVVSRLPSPTRINWTRRLILGATAACGIGVAYSSTPTVPDLLHSLPTAFSVNQTLLLEGFAAVVALFIATCFVVVGREK